MPRTWLTLSLLLTVGCYEHHRDGPDAGTTTLGPCSDFEPICVGPVSPCGPRERTFARCESGAWVCPDGSFPHVRFEAPAGGCPAVEPEAVVYVGSAGLAVESGDRCLWVLDEVVHTDPASPDPAVIVPQDLPFASCPGALPWVGGSPARRTVDRSRLGPQVNVSLLDSVRYRDVTWVFYRIYGPDPMAVWGFSSRGTAVARFDTEGDLLRVTGEGQALDGFEYGEAAWVDEDRVYLFGCRGPVDFLATECRLARTDDPADVGRYEHWNGSGWVDDPSEAAIVVNAGPERWDLMQLADGRFVMVFAGGFDHQIHTRTAPRIEGPWSDARVLLECELPSDDVDAFCREPQLHPELMDPLQVGELVVSYDINTLAPDADARRGAEPERYWPRLRWARLRF